MVGTLPISAKSRYMGSGSKVVCRTSVARSQDVFRRLVTWQYCTPLPAHCQADRTSNVLLFCCLCCLATEVGLLLPDRVLDQRTIYPPIRLLPSPSFCLPPSPHNGRIPNHAANACHKWSLRTTPPRHAACPPLAAMSSCFLPPPSSTPASMTSLHPHSKPTHTRLA